MRSTHFPWSALSAVLLCALTLPARAQEGRLGVGIVLGEPTGIAWNYRTSHVNSVDGAVGLSPSDRFRLHADYLWYAYPFDIEHLSLHYGPGAVLGVPESGRAFRGGESFDQRETEFGVRGVLGLTYRIPRSPVDMFLEVAPVFFIAPNGDMDIDAGIGARVYP